MKKTWPVAGKPTDHQDQDNGTFWGPANPFFGIRRRRALPKSAPNQNRTAFAAGSSVWSTRNEVRTCEVRWNAPRASTESLNESSEVLRGTFKKFPRIEGIGVRIPHGAGCETIGVAQSATRKSHMRYLVPKGYIVSDRLCECGHALWQHRHYPAGNHWECLKCDCPTWRMTNPPKWFTASSRFRAVESCIDEGCQCDDRAGVLLYNGSDVDEARRAQQRARSGYRFLVEEFIDGEWKEVPAT